MAVPTIVSLDPSVGHTGGRTMVDVQGTNFRLPTIPASGPTSGSLAPSVQVLFGAEPAPLVQVLSSSRLLVTAPIHDPGLVSITIRNLDDDGDAIPGEEVVLASAYEFARPKLFTDSANRSELLRLTEALIRELRRQVHENVSIATHTDYDEENGELHVVELSSLPGVVLVGPSLSENRFYSLNERPEYEVTPGDPDTEFVETDVPYTVDASFEILGFSNNQMEAINLQYACTVFFRNNKVLRMDKSSSDPSQGRVGYELDLTEDGDFKPAGQPNNSNIHSFTGRLVIRGFDLETVAGVASGGDIAGVPKGDVVNRGFTSDEDNGVDLDPVEQIGLSSVLVVRSVKSPGGC